MSGGRRNAEPPRGKRDRDRHDDRGCEGRSCERDGRMPGEGANPQVFTSIARASAGSGGPGASGPRPCPSRRAARGRPGGRSVRAPVGGRADRSIRSVVAGVNVPTFPGLTADGRQIEIGGPEPQVLLLLRPDCEYSRRSLATWESLVDKLDPGRPDAVVAIHTDEFPGLTPDGSGFAMRSSRAATTARPSVQAGTAATARPTRSGRNWWSWRGSTAPTPPSRRRYASRAAR
jgi:hypothetical protein